MFNLQGSELIIILLLALVVLGPEKLPEAMRKAGKMYGELKRMSSSFQEEFRSVVDEPLREVRETANALRDSADFTKLQQGERPEKPKSAEMVDARATAERRPGDTDISEEAPAPDDAPEVDGAPPSFDATDTPARPALRESGPVVDATPPPTEVDEHGSSEQRAAE